MTPRGVDFDPNDPLIRALRALPDARAPRTLAPRVMAAVHARLAHPPARTWFEWPLAWRVGTVAAAVMVLAGVMLAWPALLDLGRPAMDAAARRLAEVQHGAAVALNLAAVMFRTVWHPIAMPFVVFVTVMTIASATVGAMLGRVALGGASR
jgi:hypothetical protein